MIVFQLNHFPETDLGDSYELHNSRHVSFNDNCYVITKLDPLVLTRSTFEA